MSSALALRFPWVAPLMLGILFGLTLALVAFGGRVERVVVENTRLRFELGEARENLARLNNSLSRSRAPIIREIHVCLDGIGEEEANELETALRQRLQILIGKELEKADPEVVAEMLRDLKLTAANGMFVVRASQVLLAPRAFFRITVQKLKTEIKE